LRLSHVSQIKISPGEEAKNRAGQVPPEAANPPSSRDPLAEFPEDCPEGDVARG
jgi:hypothetical protein